MNFLPNISSETVLLSLAFSCLGAFIYVLNKAMDSTEDAINVAGFPASQDKSKAIKIAAFFLFFIPLFALIQWPKIWVLYAILGAIGFFYSFSVSLSGRKWRLKNIFIIKNVSAAFCWAILPVALPLIYYEQAPTIMDLIKWVNYFTFIFAIEVVWDIRDIEGDKAAGIKTLPNHWGVGVAKAICLLPIMVLFIWRYIVFEIHPIFLVAYGLTILSILLVKKDSPPYFFQNIIMIWIVANTAFIAISLS